MRRPDQPHARANKARHQNRGGKSACCPKENAAANQLVAKTYRKRTRRRISSSQRPTERERGGESARRKDLQKETAAANQPVAKTTERERGGINLPTAKTTERTRRHKPADRTKDYRERTWWHHSLPHYRLQKENGAAP